MIQGVAMLIAIVVMGANLVADLLYLAVDPRLRARALG
jgi:peptide/nickel transport system permease protein